MSEANQVPEKAVRLLAFIIASLVLVTVACAGKPQLSKTSAGGADDEAPDPRDNAATRFVPAPEAPRRLMPADYDGEPIVHLGWSPDGRFAYLMVAEEIGRDGFSVHLGLQA